MGPAVASRERHPKRMPMSVLVLSLLISAGLSGMIASYKKRQSAFWLSMGLVAGPIAVGIILWLPSRIARTSPAPPSGPRSIVEEINSLEELRQRGVISDDEFQQGKVQVLAWPLASPIPAALTP
jgi:hypothetical protein